MSTSNIRIALISMIDEERELYESLLKPQGQLSVESFKSLTQFKNECTSGKYSGIIIDLYTIVSSSTEEKDFFFSLQQGFPVMQIRRVLETGEIKGLINQKKVEGDTGIRILENFIQSSCAKSPPRGVRVYERKKILMQIHFFLAQTDSPTKSQLMNISLGGCFIQSPKEKVSEKNRIWIVIDDLQDKNPIPCRVRWKGDRVIDEKNLIGLGIQFEELTPEQRKEILEKIKAAVPDIPRS